MFKGAKLRGPLRTNAFGALQRWASPLAATLAPAAVTRIPVLKSAKVIVLTIDDGPSSRTGEILDLLAKYGAEATHFVHTDQINESNTGLLQRMRREGHDIAHHMPRDEPSFLMSKAVFEAEFERAHRFLEGIGAKRFFRPAQGVFRPSVMDASLKKFGYDKPLGDAHAARYVLSSFIPWDAGGITNSSNVQFNDRIARQYADQLLNVVFPGAIVIFHDGEGGGRAARLAASITSLERFLTGLKESGFRALSLASAISTMSVEK
ncbi:MAG: polysaccharide deacetylase family protein [Pseudomonadota bacterium]